MTDSTLHDNIASIEHTVADPATDEYMRLFDQVDNDVQAGSKYIGELLSQPNRDTKVLSLVVWADQTQKTLDNLYALLVEMNNYWAKK